MTGTAVDVNHVSRSLGQKARGMTLRSPIVAMLWENWRLTRVEAAWKLAVAIVGGLAILVVFAAVAPNTATKEFGAIVALVFIAFPNVIGWLSIPKINGARAGFPFSLHYARPVRTAVLVAVPMAYQVVMPTASYLASAFLLRVASGYPFPLLPVAAWIAAINLTHPPVNWSIPSRLFTVLGSLMVGLALVAGANLHVNTLPDGFNPYRSPSLWPTTFAFPLSSYALIAVLGLASFSITVAGVARQRHGDAPPAIPWMSGGYPEWLVNLFRFPCPTSSATRAQIWFELKSRGLPVLAIGVALATLNPLLFAASVPAGEWLRLIAVMCGLFSVIAVVLLGGNAFNIRWKPGRLYASAFEMTVPCRAARLTALKVLVRSVCVLAALVAVGVSVWASMAFIAVGENYEPLKGYQPLRSWQGAIESALGSLTGYEQVALAVVVTIGVAVMVASWAAIGALVTRYPRRVGILGWLVLLHGAVLIPLVLTGYRGFGSKELWEFLLSVLVWTTRWIDAPAIVFATLYVSWKVFAERLLSVRSACVAVLVSAAFGAAWITVLQAAGLQLSGMPVMDAAWMLSPALLPLMASVLAPWSLSRIRHT
jgi:hypothetical protein